MGARILIIEDNEPNLELMTYLLGAFGHSTFVARTGEAGLAQARHAAIDLIICDIHLPGIDGFEVAKRVRNVAELGTVPLIAVTALAMVGDQERIQAAGFDGYISKPIAPEQFVRQIEEYLAAPRRTRADGH